MSALLETEGLAASRVSPGLMVRSVAKRHVSNIASRVYPTCAYEMPISDISEIGRAAPSFETHCFAMLLRMRRRESGRIMKARHIVALATLLGLIAFANKATAAGDRALGEYLSSECVTCHQLSGRYQGIPPIVGWPEGSFVEIMDEYRSKRRGNPVMQTIAGKFSGEEIAALAAYFGSLKPKN
jgi:cytochrome c553